jgi:transposase
MELWVIKSSKFIGSVFLPTHKYLLSTIELLDGLYNDLLTALETILNLSLFFNFVFINMRRISNERKLDIISALNHPNKSFHTVAKELSVGYGTVRRVAKEAGIAIPYRKGGRPKKISQTQCRNVVRAITSGRIDTAVDASKMLRDDFDVSVSPQTVRNTLKECDLTPAKKVKKPLLTKRHRRLRLEFARRYENWTVDDWKNVIFSDETKVNRVGSDGKKWVWKKPGSPLRDNHIQSTLKHGGGSMMVWGCFSARGVGDLVLIEGILNADLYVDILNDNLLGTLNWYGLEKSEITFQHDNDPKHTSRLASQWLSDQEIDVLMWPPQSPDLNPIETLWAWFKFRLTDYPTMATSVRELWDRAQDVWNSFTQEECMRLIDSIPERISAVIKAKGGYTGF